MGKRKDRPNSLYRKTLIQGAHGYVCPIEEVIPGDFVVAAKADDLFNLFSVEVKAVHDFRMQPCQRTLFKGDRFFDPDPEPISESRYRPDKKHDLYHRGRWFKCVPWIPAIDSSPNLEIVCNDWDTKKIFKVKRISDYFHVAWAVCNVYDSATSFEPSEKIPLPGLRHMYGLELKDRSAFYLLQNGFLVGSV